jgi:Ca2+-transporting ATPase
MGTVKFAEGLNRVPYGLTTDEAAARLRREGPNELPQSTRRTLLHIAFEVVREPMFQLLIAAGLIYLFLGDLGEALMLFAFVFITVSISIVQARRTEKVLEALRDLTSPRALVIRSGERLRIAGREVVRGDLIVVAEGDRVPADALLVEANELQIDESLLT